MPEGFEIIRARIKDDVAILTGRLMRSKQPEVVFVLPKNSILAADPNSLKILRDEADSIGRTILISTENPELKKIAKKIGVQIYSSSPKNVEVNNNTRPESMKKMRKMMDIVPPSMRRRLEPTPEAIPMPTPEPKFEEPEPIPSPGELITPRELEIYSVKSEVINPKELKNNNPELEKNLEDFYIPEKLTVIVSKKKIFSFHNLMILFISTAGLSLLLTLYLILPKADIKISLKKFPSGTSIPIAVSKAVSSSDLANGIIPGQLVALSKSESRTFTISGGENQFSSTAEGFIYIYNAYSSKPQKLVAQTRFETKDGKIFRIQKLVIVPGAKMSGSKLIPSSIKADVKADAPGEDYNIGPAYFTIPGFKGTPKYAGFYAKSTEPMASSQIDSGKVLTKDLLEQGKNELANQIVNEIKSDTLNTLKDSNLVLIDGASTSKIEEFKSSIPVGAAADSFTLDMKISWQGIFFKEKDFRDAVISFINSKYPDFKNLNFTGDIVYPQATQADFKKGELFFTFDAGKINSLTADIDSLKKELAGQNENEMRSLISNQSFINSATISLWPFWVKRAPNNVERINITLDSN